MNTQRYKNYVTLFFVFFTQKIADKNSDEKMNAKYICLSFIEMLECKGKFVLNKKQVVEKGLHYLKICLLNKKVYNINFY